MWHHKPHTALLATRGCLSYTKAKIMQVRAQWSLLRLPSRSLSYTKIRQKPITTKRKGTFSRSAPPITPHRPYP